MVKYNCNSNANGKGNIVMKQTTIPKNEMKIEIQSRGFKLTEAIQAKVEEKVTSLQHFVRGQKLVKVNLSTDKSGNTVVIRMYVGKRFMKVQAVSNDLYKSIDIATGKMKNQMSKLSKSFERSQVRNSIRYTPYNYPSAKVNLKAVFEEVMPEEIADELRDQPNKYAVGQKPMSYEDAMFELESLNKEFFIFIDEGTFEQTYVAAN